MAIYSFNTDHANAYGLNEAVVIQNFTYWITKNLANKKHFHSQRTWTYNSIEALNKLFPFWSKDQMRRIIESLVDKNVLCRDRFNVAGYDKTMWYAFINESEFIDGGFVTKHTRESYKHSFGKSATSKWQYCQIEVADLPVRSGKNPKPIPDSKPNGKPITKNKGAIARDKQLKQMLLNQCDLKGVSERLVIQYLDYRKSIESPLKTALGIQKQINTLAELPTDEDRSKAVANTMENEWKKIIPLTTEKQRYERSTKNSYRLDHTNTSWASPDSWNEDSPFRQQ